MNKPIYSDVKVKQMSADLLSPAREDVVELSTFGITEDFLNDLETRLNFFHTLPDYEQQRREIRGKTSVKNQNLAECHTWCGDFRGKLEVKDPRKKGIYRLFPNERLNDAWNSETIMVEVLKNVIDMAQDYQDELSDVGVTPEFIAQGQGLLEALRTADNIQENEKGESLETTQKRYETSQSLIDDCNRIMAAGKRVFKDNPAKYVRYDLKWSAG